jgi:YVTN family beta-propeller protein
MSILKFTTHFAASLAATVCLLSMSATAGSLLVTNKGDHTLTIIDPVSGRQIANIDEQGVTGHELIASPDGKTAYVPIYGNSGVGKPGTDGTHMVVIDLEKHEVTGSVDFGGGVRPHCPMFGPKDGLLYVTTELRNSVTIIDPKTLKIAGTIPTGQAESHMLAISHDGTRGYTANVGPGTVSVLDMVHRKTLRIIPISKETQRISVSVDDKLVFTSDQRAPRLAVIDAKTMKVVHWVALPGTGYGSAPTQDGRWLVLAVPPANVVAVVDLKTMKVAHTVAVPKAPQEVLLAPDGKTAYVSCDSSHTVAAISTSDWKVEKLIPAGRGVDGLAWANGI